MPRSARGVRNDPSAFLDTFHTLVGTTETLHFWLSTRQFGFGSVVIRAGRPNHLSRKTAVSSFTNLVALLPLLMMNSESAQATGASDVAQLIEIDKRQQRAFIDRDWGVLEEILTDDYVLVASNGTELTKEDILRNAAAPGTRWEINQTSDWKVRVHGDTAIVVATLHQKGTDGGEPFDSDVKFSDTYIRVHGQWRNVHAHACKLAAQPKP